MQGDFLQGKIQPTGVLAYPRAVSNYNPIRGDVRMVTEVQLCPSV